MLNDSGTRYRISLPRQWLLPVAGTLLAVASGAMAQQSMTAEELAEYIKEQKASLEAIKANRNETESKVQALRDALAEQEQRRARVEAELEELCQEQEVLRPGSYESCLASFKN